MLCALFGGCLVTALSVLPARFSHMSVWYLTRTQLLHIPCTLLCRARATVYSVERHKLCSNTVSSSADCYVVCRASLTV